MVINDCPARWRFSWILRMAGSNARLGAIGEGHFEVLCHQGDITPNKVQFDDKGWDFFVQLPGANANCLVQVKTTQKGKRVSVKAKNWRHLATALMPTFFFVVVADKKKSPVRGYLVHITEQLARDVLSRSDRGSMDLTWADEHRLPELSGLALRQAIERHVDGDFMRYVTRKVAFLNEYRSSMVTVTMPELPADELASILADFAIGLVPPLKVKHIEHVAIEYGKKGQPKRVLEPTIEIKPPLLGQATVTLKNVGAGDRVVLRMDAYFAQVLFRTLPPQFHKTRFGLAPIFWTGLLCH